MKINSGTLFWTALAIVSGQLGSGWTASAADHLATSPAEISAAIPALRPGDTITLRDGAWQDAEIVFDAEGTAEQPITLRAQTPGKVVISGRSRLRISGRHLVVEGLFFHRAYHEEDLISFRRDSKRLAQNCRLTQCAVVEANAPNQSNETRWISVYGEHHRIDHCWLEGKTTRGATLVVWLGGAPNEHRIEHNYFGPRPRLGKNGGETIRVGDSKTSMVDSRTVVEANCFEQCDGEAEIVSNKSCENVYRGNTFLRCAGALTLRHGERCTVEANFFLGQKAPGTGGVRVIGEGHRVFNNYFADLTGKDQRAALSFANGLINSPLNGYFQVKNAVAVFNTFVNCKQAMLIGQSDPDAGNDVPPADCTVGNNLVLGSGSAVELRARPGNFRWLGNLVSRAASDVPALEGIRVVELSMQQDGAGVWRSPAASVAIGAAEGEFPFVTEDIDGQPRRDAKDAGCDQVVIGAPMRVPLRPTDVGPSWRVPGVG